MAKMNNCRNCRWFSEPGNKIGDCRLNPPALANANQLRWPKVWASDGCAKFEFGQDDPVVQDP